MLHCSNRYGKLRYVEGHAPVKAYIEGGVPPHGSIRVSGAKNSATRLLSAALLTDDVVQLGNFPTKLVDVGHKIDFIRSIGADIDVDDLDDSIKISAGDYGARSTDNYDVPIRTTYLLVAGQLLRTGHAKVPYPGGCKIGARGYDMHIMVWKTLGCEVEELPDYISVKARKFVGARIDFPISTVGGTENALICSAVAEGTTEIFNAYITPEVYDLIKLLRQMGASIEVIGNSHIIVNGKSALSGARMNVMPDRIEALTWIVLAIVLRGKILVEGVSFKDLESSMLYLQASGIDLLTNRNSAYVHSDVMPEGVQPFEVPCGTHPGVISDMQPFFVFLALAASGTSRIFDYRYPERIGYVQELAKFCPPGSLHAEFGKITVKGPVRFHAAEAQSTDLRGSMALIMAALAAEGSSVIHDAHMALRGYNDLAHKLKTLGMNIRIDED